jgi:hypothetical protein
VTAGPGQTILNQLATGGDTYWAQRSGSIPGSGTPVTVSVTPTGNGAWNLAAVEIRRQ